MGRLGTSSPQVKLMKEEREKIRFHVDEITNLLDDGPDNTRIQNDPITGDLDLFYKSQEEKYINGLKRTVRLKRMGLDWNDETVQRAIKIGTMDTIGMLIHSIAFTPSVRNLGSPEHVKKWIPLANDNRIIGAYAQTELGHGTNLRGLETTATFIPETQEFEINCPNLTSMKWLAGDLGKNANHALIMANLIINEQEYGMHPFIVQIRDLDTHEPLPGVLVGDIGRIFADKTYDNGFLHMDHLRIPKENMLTGVAEVDADGNYHLKCDPKLLYAGMMLLRVKLIDDSAIIPMQIACTIATRYSLVRKQGSINPGVPEVSVLDYVTQQRKILPLIAQAYGFHFTARRTRFYYYDVMEKMKQSDFAEIPELHAISAGMKAYITEHCLAGTDICRRACGGHGYLEASGFPKILLGQMASVTYEGENTVMYLQCARYLVKCAAFAITGKTLKGFLDYLNDDVLIKSSAYSKESMLNQDVLLQCLRHRANRMVKDAHHKIQRLINSGKTHQEAWNLTSVELVEMTKAHLDVYVMSTFIEVIKAATGMSHQSKEVLSNLCSLLGLHFINRDIGNFLVDGYVNGEQATNLMEAELSCLSVLRPDALGLVDAFDFTDKTLQSCLGAYDGNVYERLFENAKRSPRNKTEVHEEFYEIFKGRLQQGRDALQQIKAKL